MPCKQTSQWIRQITRTPGWTVRRTGSGHLKVRAPDGRLAVIPHTPGSRHSLRSSRALLRRLGLDI
jgi:hypothetical protein